MRLELKNTDEITRQNEAMPENEIAPIAEQALDGAAIDHELKPQIQPLDVVSTGNGTVGLWDCGGFRATLCPTVKSEAGR